MVGLRRSAPGACPLRAKFFSILCRFLENLTKSYVGTPSESRCPLLQGILDPPLPRSMTIGYCFPLLTKRLKFSKLLYVCYSLILDVDLMALGDGMIICGKRSAFYSQTACCLIDSSSAWMNMGVPRCAYRPHN